MVEMATKADLVDSAGRCLCCSVVGYVAMPGAVSAVLASVIQRQDRSSSAAMASRYPAQSLSRWTR